MGESKTIEIIDTFERRNLGEGRTYGLGYSILKKESENVYKSLLAFTACKDYLNDVIFSEKENMALGAIHGLSYEPTGVFKDQDYFYLGLRSLNFLSGREYSNYELIKEYLLNNNQNLIKALNRLEVLFELDNKTVLEVINEDTLILKIPIFWAKETYLISLYALVCRLYFHVTSEDLEKTDDKFFKTVKPFMSEDGIMQLSISKILDKAFRQKLVKIPEPSLGASGYYIHNYGYMKACQHLQKL